MSATHPAGWDIRQMERHLWAEHPSEPPEWSTHWDEEEWCLACGEPLGEGERWASGHDWYHLACWPFGEVDGDYDGEGQDL